MTFRLRSGPLYFAHAGLRGWLWWTPREREAEVYEDRGKAERVARAVRECVRDVWVECVEVTT
jgi:hypothetical protein